MRRLVGWVRERFGLRCCRETIRAALHRRKLSWKKAKRLLGWAERGQRLWVASRSPGLSARVSFDGLYFYNEGQVRLWPDRRANGEHTVEVLQRLRAEAPDRTLIVLWDGAPYHRAQAVREAARALDITLMPLPGYSPDLMPVEALWHWLREDVTYHHCHASAEDLTRRAADFEARINQDPCALADRLWVKDCLDPEEEKLRFSNETWFRFSPCDEQKSPASWVSAGLFTRTIRRSLGS